MVLSMDLYELDCAVLLLIMLTDHYSNAQKHGAFVKCHLQVHICVWYCILMIMNCRSEDKR